MKTKFLRSMFGEPKNQYNGLSWGRVKRMLRGKGKITITDHGMYKSIYKGGIYIGAYWRATKTSPSNLYLWPADWKK